MFYLWVSAPSLFKGEAEAWSAYNAYQHEQPHHERVEKIGNNLDWVDESQAACHQHLCAIRNDALGKAGKGVEDAGRATRVDAEALRNLLGQIAHGENGDGVVCGAEISEDHQSCQTEFCATFARDALGEAFEDEIDAP